MTKLLPVNSKVMECYKLKRQSSDDENKNNLAPLAKICFTKTKQKKFLAARIPTQIWYTNSRAT
jgi:hypothetical protein